MEQPGTFPRRILLADDDQGVRDVVKFILRLDGHQVVEARNGKEALRMFSAGAFDLVITDYAMPEMLGHELASNIRRLAPSQRILMISGYAELWKQAASVVDAFLGKPFSLEQLRDAVSQLLAQPAAAH